MGRLAVIGALSLVPALASADAINVSFGGSAADAPSPTYAAAGGAGTWNSVSGVAGPAYQLVGTDGAPTNISVTQSPTATVLSTTDPSVSGDDAKLLDTGLVTTGAETCLMFTGFAAGQYEVLIYAWLPNQPTVLSRTRQDEAPSTVDVGGAWSGHHAENVTYARYVVTVGSDGNLPAHSGLAPGQTSAALNGVQIRPLSATTPPDGAPDAGGGGGGGGGVVDDAGTTTSSSHHGGCSAGGAPGLVVLAVLALRRRRRR